MIIRSYLDWSQNASSDDRALAVGILAELYLAGELSDEDRRNAEAALTLVLDDPSHLVRKTLAEIVGGSPLIPRHIILGLMQDRPDIACLVIANSPLLRDGELAACLEREEEIVHLAVAQRATVSPKLALAIAQTGGLSAVIAMLENAGAQVPEECLSALLEKFGHDGSLRELLVTSTDIPVDVRMALIGSTAEHLTQFAQNCGWLSAVHAERLKHDTKECAAVALAVGVAASDVSDVALRLRRTGELTPQLLLRTVLSGDSRLLVAALADLSGVSHEKAVGFVNGRSGIGFRALYRKAGLPAGLLPAFEAALSALREFGAPAKGDRPKLSLRMIESVLTSVAVVDQPETERLLQLLGRYHAEAAREAAHERIVAIRMQELPKAVLDQDDLERELTMALELEFQRAA